MKDEHDKRTLDLITDDVGAERTAHGTRQHVGSPLPRHAVQADGCDGQSQDARTSSDGNLCSGRACRS